LRASAGPGARIRSSSCEPTRRNGAELSQWGSSSALTAAFIKRRCREPVSKWGGTGACGSNRVAMKKSAASSARRRVGRSAPYPWRVSDRVWAVLGPLLADPPRRFSSPGRCRYSARACLEGILYVLYTDTPWLQVPYRELGLRSGETCRRRLEEWSERGLLPAALAIIQE